LTEWSIIVNVSLMARPKEFESETALNGAIELFSKHGFEGTSTEDLVRVMGISRQSMYDTFGDKWQLYLRALQQYTADNISGQIRELSSAKSALAGLEAVMNFIISQAMADPDPKCLGVSAICEFGRSEAEVSMITNLAGKTLLSALESRISEAKAAGAIDNGMDAQIAAQFIMATLVGLKVAARAGATAETLRGIARLAIRSLKV
jgi:AcrR family transcriptional regulator